MPVSNRHLSLMTFKIDGQTPSDPMTRNIREVVVDTSIYLPDMFVIHFNDPDFSWIDSTLLEIGKPLKFPPRLQVRAALPF